MQTESKISGVDRVEEATGRLLEMFQSGNLPQAVARTLIAAKAGEVPSAKWSFGNQLLMMIAGTEDARGFKRWQEVGRRVRKGAKAFYILAPRTIRKTERDEDGTERKVTLVVGFLGVPVFRYEDTEGDEIQRPTYTPDVLPPLYEVARAWGYEVTYGPASGSAYGWHRAGHIHLMTYDMDTLWHELAHAAHAKVLAERGRALKGGQVPAQEIVAEMTAAVLAVIYGDLGGLKFSREYIAAYAKAWNKDLLGGMMHCLGDVQKCLALILDTAAAAEPVARTA